ncbi:MAG: EthD domain-containing protein [Pseudomonadota bacterium]
MVKLTYLVHRRPDLTEDEFEERWSTTHGAFVAAHKDALRVTGYAMAPRTRSSHDLCLTSSRGLTPNDYDGVIEITWPSMDDYQEAMGSPEGLKLLDDMIGAERGFIDLNRSTAFFTAPVTLVDDQSPIVQKKDFGMKQGSHL